MLNALENVCKHKLYSYQGKYFEEFHTYSGIQQGVASSVLLFNAFKCIYGQSHRTSKHECATERLLDTLHTHTDG